MKESRNQSNEYLNTNLNRRLDAIDNYYQHQQFQEASTEFSFIEYIISYLEPSVIS